MNQSKQNGVRNPVSAQWLEVMQFKEMGTPIHWFNSNKNNDYTEDEKSNEEENAYIGSIYIEEAGLLLRFTHVRLAVVFGIQTWNTWRWHSEFSEQRVKKEAKQVFCSLQLESPTPMEDCESKPIRYLSLKERKYWENHLK